MIVLAGPTAAGKSEAALLLAERMGGEIVSVDSMQVYRGMNIGTAKPSASERARVPHHLIDVVDVREPFDAARFAKLAAIAVSEIRERGRTPVLCGGTGLYFRAYLEGLGGAPGSDPDLRAKLAGTPLEELLEELARTDPATFERIDRRNPRRVIRAIEVLRLTGKPHSEQKASWTPITAPSDPTMVCFGLTRASSELQKRINQRVDRMFAEGLMRETADLLKHGLGENPTALQALGYRQAIQCLKGELTLDQTIELVKVRTRQFAKRQMTWFRRQMNLEWIFADSGTTEELVNQMISRLR